MVGKEVHACRQRPSVTSINFTLVYKPGYWGGGVLRIGAGRTVAFNILFFLLAVPFNPVVLKAQLSQRQFDL